MEKINGVSQVEGKDNRFIESCFRVLQSKKVQINAEFESPVEGARIINNFFASLDKATKNKEKMVQSLIAEANQSLIPFDEFSWVKDDERACYFLWASIYLYSYAAYPALAWDAPTLEFQPKYIHFYSQLNLKTNPSSSIERFNEVVKYFDQVEQPRVWRLDLIAHLKGVWGQIFSSRKPFPWLEKDNDEQCRWAWEYMRKSNIYISSKPMTHQFSPTSTAEIYLAIYAIYDTWRIDYGTRRLFKSDFNKAWQQKKLRDGRQGKKACSLVLHEDVKLKLDELAKTRKVTLSQLVEQLIEKEHRLKDN